MRKTEQTSPKVDPEQKYALVLLIKEIADQLDDVHSLKKAGHPGGISQAVLTEMCSVLKELPPEMQAEYFNMLPTLFQESEPAKVKKIPEEKLFEAYSERSRDVKIQFLEQLKAQLKVRAA